MIQVLLYATLGAAMPDEQVMDPKGEYPRKVTITFAADKPEKFFPLRGHAARLWVDKDGRQLISLEDGVTSPRLAKAGDTFTEETGADRGRVWRVTRVTGTGGVNAFVERKKD